MDNTVFLAQLRESSLEEGRAFIEAHLDELSDHAAIGDLLADEALKQLYNPFLSLKLAELLIFFGEIAESMYTHALGLKAKGDALLQIRHHQAAIESLDAAGEEFLILDDERNWARSRISWMVSAASLGKAEEALQHASRAREIFSRLDEPYWICVIDHNTAWIYKQVGRYQDAVLLYKHLLTVYPGLTDQSEIYIKRAIAMAKGNLATTLAWLGEFEQAYRFQQEAQDEFVTLKETNMAVNSEINLANFDYTQGYYGSALRRYYQAQDTMHQHNIDNPRTMAELKLQIANVLVKLNRADEACRLGNEAVEISRQLGTSLHTSNVLREYATALVASGRLKEALAILYEARELFERGGFDHYAAVTQLQHAELLLEMGEYAQAYDEARITKTYFDDQGLVARSTNARLIMIGSLIERVQHAEKLTREQEQKTLYLKKAIKLCEQVALQARQYHLQEEVYKSQYLLGRLFALQGNLLRAMRHYAAAIAQIERILNDLAFDLSPSFLHTAWAVYEDTIALCLEQQQTDRAFSFLERARSMALRQYLHISKISLDEEERRRENASSLALQENRAVILRTKDELKVWQDRYRSYSTLFTQVDTTVSPSVEREVIEAELERCETKLSELFEHLYLLQATSRLTVSAKRGKTSNYLDVAQLHQLFSPSQLLLAYFLYKDRVIIFAVTNNQLATYEIPDGMKQLKRLLPLLHAHLQTSGWPNPQQPPQQAIRHMLNKLYQLLITPVQSLLPPRTGQLTIVPYGPLHTLPFHALYNGSHYLIEDFQINYLPASSLLMTSSRHTSKFLAKPPLIFGYSGHGQLQRAVEEAKTLAVMLSGHCYLEDEATIARLIEEAPGSPIIHLATHGHSRLDAPNFSSVHLADGRFNAIDAFSLNLQDCELVTLSGCETGLALTGGGDEQLGLGRAFLAAGANSLVMSLWPVDDKATSEFMQLFYQNLLHGDSKAQALHRTQYAFIHRPNSIYSHPYYWAAFRLVGDIGPLRFRKLEDHAQALEIQSLKK